NQSRKLSSVYFLPRASITFFRYQSACHGNASMSISDSRAITLPLILPFWSAPAPLNAPIGPIRAASVSSTARPLLVRSSPSPSGSPSMQGSHGCTPARDFGGAEPRRRHFYPAKSRDHGFSRSDWMAPYLVEFARRVMAIATPRGSGHRSLP